MSIPIGMPTDVGMFCNACGRACNQIRKEHSGQGFCHSGLFPKVALAKKHMGEEPIISGSRGSGTVFFSGCTLKCVFCQNYEISHQGQGHSITPKRLSEIFEELEGQGVHNINLVNPTHYVYAIQQALSFYKPNIPIVYNTGSYDAKDTIDAVSDWADIFLADLKLIEPTRCKRYLGAPNYFSVASRAVDRMLYHRSQNRFGEDGMLLSGVVLRILVLPCNLDEAYKLADYIATQWGTEILVSVMSQYYPAGTVAVDCPEINRPITAREYAHVCNYFARKGFSNGYYQHIGSATKELTPDFNGEGI